MSRLILLLCLTIGVYAQDPIKALPNNYKLQFENEWVKVTRVHYGPHEKVPKHDHILFPTAFVYLNEAGPIVFSHTNWSHPDLVRPVVTLGSFRLSPKKAKNETHAVENKSDKPSDLLRVEFKSIPVKITSLQGRFKREDYLKNKNLRKIEFENDDVRITRIICTSRKSIELNNMLQQPSLLVAITNSHFNLIKGNTKVKDIDVKFGETMWDDNSQNLRLENLSDNYIEFLKFDLKNIPKRK